MGTNIAIHMQTFERDVPIHTNFLMSVVIYLNFFYQELIKKKFQPIKFVIRRKSWRQWDVS